MLKAFIKTMRPRQWTKNIFLFAAIVFDRKLLDPTAIGRTIAGFILFSLLSSCVYIFNDIADIEADQKHPKKRFRPIAAGTLPVPIAITGAILIITITMPISFWISIEFGSLAILYFIINIAYSNWLKHVALIDVMIVASGFVLRVAAGVSLIQVERFSPWLYVVTTLFALYIGFGKRRAELTMLAQNANAHRRVLDGYSISFLDQLITIVSSITIIAYSLYTFSAPNVPSNHSMMLTIPFVLYGIFRYLYLIKIKEAGGAPEEIILSDRPLQITFLLWTTFVLIIFYLY
ncbi:MAG: decaprenyl-phosphate phosphoribosyltransferase [Anaerolineaceae bacterium]|nr:decaprenyl-phosphate phosphoribosyltransferase [Anaerolineaceae bacterium]